MLQLPTAAAAAAAAPQLHGVATETCKDQMPRRCRPASLLIQPGQRQQQTTRVWSLVAPLQADRGQAKGMGWASSNCPDLSCFVRVAPVLREACTVGKHGALGREVLSVARCRAMGREGVGRGPWGGVEHGGASSNCSD